MTIQRCSSRSHAGALTSAFTLLEVLIAMGIFFVAIFAILGLTSQNIAAARSLQRVGVDITHLAAELSLTNRLEEGVESGDFGDLFPKVHWTRQITEVSTNGLFQIDLTLFEPPLFPRSGQPAVESKLTFLLYRPATGPGSPQRR
jgi:Tfp pilus assembly protein PilV